MESGQRFRQRLMVFTAVGLLGFLLVAGPALAASYMTTKISDPAYQKWDAYPTSTGEIVLVANPKTSPAYAAGLTYEGQAIFLYQNHLRKKITTADYTSWASTPDMGGKYLLDGSGSTSSAIYLYDGATTKKISNSDYAFWNAEWCGSNILLYGNTLNTTSATGRAAYLYKNGTATKISNSDYWYWGGQTTGTGVLLFGYAMPTSSAPNLAVYMYYNNALKKISNKDYSDWTAWGMDQKVILNGTGSTKSEIYLYDGAVTSKISPSAYAKWAAYWLDKEKIILLGNPTTDLFEAEAIYVYASKTATKITNSTYKFWKIPPAVDLDGTSYDQLLLNGRTADNAKSAIYLYKGGAPVLISPTTYLRWDAHWDWHLKNVILVADPPVLSADPSPFVGKALYLYTGTPAVKVSNSSYSYWRFVFNLNGYAPAGQLLMLAGNSSYDVSAVWLYAGGVTKLINPAGLSTWDAQWDSLARIVMTGSKMSYPDYKSEVYLYKGSTTPKISTAAYPYWYCWDWYQDGAGKHLLQGTDFFNPGSAMYLYNLTNTVKISPADYKYWNGVWHSNTLAVLIGSTANVYGESGKAIYVSSGATGVKVSTAEYTDWDYLRDYMNYENHPLLLKGHDAANTRSAIYLVEPDTRPYSKYSFTFSYNNGLGDWYKGYFYAPTGYNGYKVGYTRSVVDENGDPGKYLITAALDIGKDSSRYGQVFVTEYTDRDQCGKTFKPVNYSSYLGTNFLGSELGYIKNAGVEVYKFGLGYYEADAGDTYTFRYTYTNGDYYEGKVYRDSISPTYYPLQKINVVNELKLTGYYQILGVSHTGVDSSKYGQVFVSKYYDGDQSKKPFTPLNYTTPLGTNFLGSELGYIKNAGVEVYKFGMGFYEADAGDTYTFRYTYTNGDYYEGKVYRDPLSTIYYPLQKINVVNELTLTGYYQILGVSHANVASSSYGQVFLTKYYDGDQTKKFFTPVTSTLPKGTKYLKSELGYIKNAGVLVYRFGMGFYEADAGDTYTYRYTYGNGDYYEGRVYRDPLNAIYYPGQKINAVNELGKTGYYDITGVSHSGVDSTKYGQVFLTRYYDGDLTKRTFTPVGFTLPKGTKYLKSELGYIKNAGVEVYKFGMGLYEADAGDTYTYRYTYTNGDYYEGRVYRDPLSAVYYPGQKIDVANELGKTGYYDIKTVSYSAAASSLYGKVYVTKYYDGDQTTPKTYTGAQLLPANPVYTWFGAGYLQTEHGYIGSRTNSVSPNYFGKGFYEADL